MLRVPDVVAVTDAPLACPKQVRVHRVFRYRILSRKVVLMDVETVSLDVPYGELQFGHGHFCNNALTDLLLIVQGITSRCWKNGPFTRMTPYGF